MIAVIADDLTGAAELGGIGLRHGLRTEISTTVHPSPGADLLIIAADSRSKEQSAAVEEMTTITRQLSALQPLWIYKKTDSVLRGHVIAELNAHLQALHLSSALLVPANPLLGRTIRDGSYYLNGQPIHYSAFSVDPEFPVLSSVLQDMLHTRQQPVQVLKTNESLPVHGIAVGEVEDTADLQSWARRIPAGTLAAGAAGFFSALLDARLADAPGIRFPADPQVVHGHPTAPPPFPGYPILFISGSTFDSSRAAIRQQFENGGPVSYMPDKPDALWQKEVIRLLHDKQKAIVAIAEGHHESSARELRTAMAIALAAILEAVRPAELIIEGGATAYAILKETGWHTFVPEQELAPGVIRMSVPEAPGLYITVKPGSYRWLDSPIH